MNTTHSSQACIDQCNELLRGEISAVQTYAMALRRFPDEESSPLLREIRDEHAASVEELRENIERMGGEPITDPGAWGSFARTVEKAASLLGEGAAVEALRQGEQYGVGLYRSAIDSEDTEVNSRLLYSERLLPRLFTHLTRLESIQP